MTDRARPGLVTLYDIRPGNGAGQFLQPRSPHGASLPCGNNWKHVCLGLVLANFLLPSTVTTLHCYYDSVKRPCIVRVTASLKSVHC